MPSLLSLILSPWIPQSLLTSISLCTTRTHPFAHATFCLFISLSLTVCIIKWSMPNRLLFCHQSVLETLLFRFIKSDPTGRDRIVLLCDDLHRYIHLVKERKLFAFWLGLYQKDTSPFYLQSTRQRKPTWQVPLSRSTIRFLLRVHNGGFWLDKCLGGKKIFSHSDIFVWERKWLKALITTLCFSSSQYSRLGWRLVSLCRFSSSNSV